MLSIQNFHQIRVLYVCAQVGSFTEASNVLGCSQSAVSQSIKQTESRLGFDLFHRSGKGIALTPSGRRFLKTLEASWGKIERSAEAEKRASVASTVRVCAPPSFTLNWLLPRIPDFYRMHENIFIELETKENIVHTDESDADLVIAYWNYDRTKLLEESIFPVCSPEFAQENNLDAGMSEHDLIMRLVELPLIGEYVFPFGTRLDGWAYWAQHFNMSLHGVAIRRHAMSHISIREAELGVGVALGRSTLCADALSSGRLICLPSTKIYSPYHFYLESKVNSDAAHRVEDWLKNAAHNCTTSSA